MDGNKEEKFIFITDGEDSHMREIESNYTDTEANLIEGKVFSNHFRFIADTRATEHMINQDECLVNAVRVSEDRRIKGANKNLSADIKIEKVDNIIAKGASGKIIELKNV